MSSNIKQANQTDIVVNVADCTECKKVLKLLQVILDGEATKSEEEFFFQNLEKCPNCIDCYENEKQLREAIKNKSKKREVPQDLIDCIQNKIKGII